MIFISKLKMHKLATISIVASLSACGLGDIVRPGSGSSVLLLAEDNPLSIASAQLQSDFPNMAAANASNNPKFIDSHPAGANHGELEGFGVTMIAHNGSEPLIKFDKIIDSSLEVDDPNLLFFEKSSGSQSNWNIIGAGYAIPYDPSLQPQLLNNGTALVPPYKFLVHEAGYHNVLNGNFTCATDSNLKNSVVNAGISIAPQGVHTITRDDLKTKVTSKRHGRYWTLHVWYDPATGRPAVAETDPWTRQSASAGSVPSCAFYLLD